MSPQYRFAPRLVAALFALSSVAAGLVGGSDGASAEVREVWNGRIVFTRDMRPGDDAWPMYSMNPDGTDFEALPEQGVMAQFNADGTRISYCGWDGLTIADSDGSNPQVLGKFGCNGFRRSWSPDESTFATISSDDPWPVVLVDKAGVAQALPNTDSAMWPAFTPTGEVIYVDTDYYDDSAIRIHNVESGETRTLFTVTSSARFPSLINTGQQIVYVGVDGIHIANSDGSNDQLLVDGDKPEPSPDGKWIAFERYGEPGIHVIRTDGTGHERLTTGKDSYPTWQPVFEDPATTTTTSTTTTTMPNQPPVAKFAKFAQVKGHYVVTSGAPSTDADGNIVSYEWRWGDGSPPSNTKQAWHKYSRSGWALIRLTVTDDQGASTTRGIWYFVN